MISVLLMAAALAVPVPAAHGALKPRLTLEGDPVVVRGYHFAALEHVHVTVSANGRFSRDVVASSFGFFRIRFRAASIEGCGIYTITAVGNKGSRAWFKRQVECPPPAP